MPTREEYLRSLYAWLITEALEEAHYIDLITEAERDDFYWTVGNLCDLPDLLQRPLEPTAEMDELSENIQKRVRPTASNQRRDEMHKGLILCKNADHAPSSEALQKAVAQYDKYFGVSCVLDKELYFEQMAGKPRVDGPEGVEATLNNNQFKPLKCILFLGGGVNEFQKEDFQPFSVLENDGGDAIISAFVEGDFSAYAKDKSTFSNEYHFVEDFLAEWVTNIYIKKNKDFAETIKFITSKECITDIENEIGTDGVVVLQFADENETVQVIQKGRKDTFGVFEWGWMSNNLGIKAPSATSDNTNLPDFDKMSARQKLQWERENKTTIAEALAQAKEKAANVETTPTPTDPNADEVIKIPATLQGKARKDWMQEVMMSGVRWPDGWQKAATLPANLLNTKSKLVQSLLKEQDKIKDLKGLTAIAGGKRLPTTILPQQRNEILEKVLKDVTLMTVEEIKQEVEKAETFYEQTNYSLADVLCWTTNKYKSVTQFYPQAGMCIVNDLRNLLFRYVPDIINKIRDEEKKVDAGETVKPAEPNKEEEKKDDLPDFSKMSARQRLQWERQNPELAKKMQKAM